MCENDDRTRMSDIPTGQLPSVKPSLLEKLEACNDACEDKVIALVPNTLHAPNKAFVKRWLVINVLAQEPFDNPLGIGLEPSHAVEMAYQALVQTASQEHTELKRRLDEQS